MAKKLLVGIGLMWLVGGNFLWASQKELTKRIESAREYLKDLMAAPDRAIPQALLQDCKGVLVLRQYKAGFVLGVKGGVGVVLVKDENTRQWSPPAFITAGEGSFGFQIGGQAIDSVFLIMNKEGMDMLIKSKFKIGVDASAAVGPVGRDAAAKVSPGTAILVYSRAKGLYAGATFEGGFLVSDDKANEEFYKMPGISVRDILFRNRVKMPKVAKPLVADLERYSAPTE